MRSEVNKLADAIETFKERTEGGTEVIGGPFPLNRVLALMETARYLTRLDEKEQAELAEMVTRFAALRWPEQDHAIETFIVEHGMRHRYP